MESSDAASAQVGLRLSTFSREHLQNTDPSLDFHGRSRLQIAMVEAHLAACAKDAKFPTELIDKLQKALTSLEDVSEKELRSLHIRSECVLDTINKRIDTMKHKIMVVQEMKEEGGSSPQILRLEQTFRGSAEQLMRTLEDEKERLKIAST